jgi:hypothetical protein
MTNPTAAALALRLGISNGNREPAHLTAATLESEADAAGVDLTDPAQWAAYLAGYGMANLGPADVADVMAALTAATAAL